MRFFLIGYVSLLSVLCLSAQDLRDKAADLGITGQFGQQLFSGGGGVSFFDFNKDGLEDLTFCSAVGQNIFFFQNNGDSFSPITFPGIYNYSETKQAVWVDVDNDDDYDLFVTAFSSPDLLYINDGNMNFMNETVFRGLGIYYENSYGVDFFDINNDGCLDIYISNYDDVQNPNQRNYLYLCDINTYTYTDISISSGAHNGSQQSHCSVAFDYDSDGDLDFALSNDRSEFPNALYRNNGDLSFTDISDSVGSDISIWSMNTVVGDYNNDSHWDLYHTNLNQAVLLEGSPSGAFSDVAPIQNVSFNRFGWAGNFIDYDNDADLDLYVVSSLHKPNAFYVNDGTGLYSEPFLYSGGLDGTDTLQGYSSAMADFDNNGLLDIAVIKPQNPFSLYINYEASMNKWVKLDLKGITSNRDGVGAYIESWTNGSKRIFHKHVSNGYLNQHSNLIHIGIGTHPHIDSLFIRWPYPNSQEFIQGPISPNRTYVIEEGSGIIDSIDPLICYTDLDIHLMPIPSSHYTADVLSSDSRIDSLHDVTFSAESEVILNVDFEVSKGADFQALIDSCQ